MKHLPLSLSLFTLLVLLLSACNSIYDDLSSCPQSLVLRFYNQTPCDDGVRHPERLVAMDRVAVGIFDQSGRLVYHRDFADLKPSPAGRTLQIPLAEEPGVYSIVCWGGEDLTSTYQKENLEKGNLIDQIFWSIKSELNPLAQLLPDLYFGRTQKYEIQAPEVGSLVDTVDVNMLRYTNDLRLKVKGLKDVEQYAASITDDNAAYSYLGVSLGREVVYTQPLHQRATDEIKETAFSLLRLDREKVMPQLTITNKDGKRIYSQGLIEIIDAVAKYGHAAPINFDCQHTFDVTLTLEEKGDTYMLIEITINGWNVVVRDVILS